MASITAHTLETLECSITTIQRRRIKWWTMVLSLSSKSKWILRRTMIDQSKSDEFWFSIIAINNSETTTMCHQFENFSRNCPETMFKSHFNEVIILQLFITLASNPNDASNTDWTVAISKTNSHSASNPFRKHTLFNAYQSNVFK